MSNSLTALLRASSCSLCSLWFTLSASAADPTWSDWQKYRATVSHPTLTIKPADLARAKDNLARHPWAKDYLARLESSARKQLPRLTPAFLQQMIPDTTPGDRIFTPCPACRDQGKPYHAHGNWQWSDARPEQLTCIPCGTVFPNDKYPETVKLHAKHGGGQTLTFYGGEPFPVFAYKHGRPSFTGNIRARKLLFMTDLARSLAEAHALTANPDYARAVRDILVRMADVYPRYMVHIGYGEFADLDPATAATHIENLPADELVYPPNKPDRKLHTGFWTAGRVSGTGLEGAFLRKVAVAYDLTCTAPGVWTDAQRQHVERDLLLDGTSLLTADPAINNKSVTNRTAGAMIGMTVGEPSLVRWGLAGFHDTIDKWFLPDGGTPESFAYALMSLNGLEDIVLAARGYTDPAGYTDASGKRLDNLDLFQLPAYSRIWSNLFHSLQGNLKFPPLADSYTTSSLTPRQAELLAANYPNHPQYLSLLKELAGPNLADSDPSVALYYRDPDLASKPSPPLAFNDHVLPNLRIATLRTGPDGRESLLALDASHWGTHHHIDSLNLYYWKNGQELLSDLGYLWDHPLKKMTARTVAHNTVVLDESDQITKERGGEITLFHTSPQVKIARAKSNAYPQATQYERTAILIDHDNGHSYVLDLFTVAGGKTQDYVFHLPTPNHTLEHATPTPVTRKLYDFTNPQQIHSATPWTLTCPLPDNQSFTAWALPADDETTYLATGWGQRDYKNSDVNATLPYIIRRHPGPTPHTFTSLFTGHPTNKPLIQSARRDGNTLIITLTTNTEDRITLTGPDIQIESRQGDAITVLYPAPK